MAASTQDRDRNVVEPLRFTGRSFASMDPERVREVVPGALARAAARHNGPLSAQDAGWLRSSGVLGPQVNQASQGGNEGGSSRR